MARVGRKPQRLEHVEKVTASELARSRLKWILATLAGEATIPEACAALEINEARFHELRNDWLQAAAASLEPAPLGRPPRAVSPDAEQIAALREQVRRLKAQLDLADLRVELARTLPHVGSAKKKPSCDS